MNIYVDGSAKGIVLGAGLVIAQKNSEITYHSTYKIDEFAEGNLSEIFAIETAIKYIVANKEMKATIFSDNPMVVQEILSTKDIIETKTYKLKAFELRKELLHLKDVGFDITIKKYGKCMKNKNNEMLEKAHSLSRDSYQKINKIFLQIKPKRIPKDDIYIMWIG